MKPRIITTAAVVGLLAALAAGDVFAAGRGKGAGNGGGNGTGMQTRTHTQTRSQSAAAGTAASRPADSQRRDGTFLTTGTTANGSTTRQGKGNGLMDGSHLTTPATTPATAP